MLTCVLSDNLNVLGRFYDCNIKYAFVVSDDGAQELTKLLW